MGLFPTFWRLHYPNAQTVESALISQEDITNKWINKRSRSLERIHNNYSANLSEIQRTACPETKPHLPPQEKTNLLGKELTYVKNQHFMDVSVPVCYNGALLLGPATFLGCHSDPKNRNMPPGWSARKFRHTNTHKTTETCAVIDIATTHITYVSTFQLLHLCLYNWCHCHSISFIYRPVTVIIESRWGLSAFVANLYRPRSMMIVSTWVEPWQNDSRNEMSQLFHDIHGANKQSYKILHDKTMYIYWSVV